MDIGRYRQFLEEYVREAVANSNGTPAGIAEYLWAKKMPGRLASHREEKQEALNEARKAFDEHRHWPIAIILSFLGIENKDTPRK